jgi:hypothetical protein
MLEQASQRRPLKCQHPLPHSWVAPHPLTGLRPSPPRRVVVAPVGRCGDRLCPGMNRPWAVGGLVACVRPEPIMTLPRTAADVLSEHVVFEVESLDRMYLNVYVPELQRVGQVVGFLTRHRGFEIASTALVAPMSKDFIAGIGRYAADHNVPVIDFVKGQRKDDVMHEYLARSEGSEGVLFIGRAQEKAWPPSFTGVDDTPIVISGNTGRGAPDQSECDFSKIVS